MKKAKLAALISFVLIFVFMGIAAGFNSDWGKVDVRDVYYPNSEGGIIHAQLFVPKNASSADPLPAILNMHGGSDYLQTVSNYSIELARRGYVVLSVDAYGSGWSDYIDGAVATTSGQGKTGTSSLKMDGGASLGIEQLLSYKFVDKENIGLIGHSMGGTYIANAALEYADNVKAIMPWGSGSFVDKMKSSNSEDYKFNVGYINAASDEMVYFATREVTSKLMDSPELKNFVGTDKTIEAGKIYGSFSDQTARVIYTPNASHIGNIICRDSIGALCSFFSMAMPTGVEKDSTDQVWMYKETFCVLGTIALFAFVISLGFVFADSSLFASVKNPMALSTEDKSNKWIKLVLLLVAIAVPALTLHKVGLNLAAKKANSFMPMNWANVVAGLAVVNAAILLVIFVLWYFIFGKKNGAKISGYGFSAGNGKKTCTMILASVLLAVSLVAVMYIIVNLIYALFKIDFRFWQFGVMPISLSRFAKILGYLICYLFAFGVMNVVGIAFAGVGKEEGKKSVALQYLLGWLIGAGGYLVILLIYYIGLKTTQKPPFFIQYPPFVPPVGIGHPNSLVLSMKTTVLVPTFTLLSFLNTALYRKTKNIYVGWFVCALIATMIVITTNAFAA